MFTKLLNNNYRDHAKKTPKSLDDVVPLNTKKTRKKKHVLKSLDDVVPLSIVEKGTKKRKKVRGSTELKSKASSKVDVPVSAQMRNSNPIPTAQTTKPKVTSQPALFATAVPPPASAFVQSPSHHQPTVKPLSPMPLEDVRQRSNQGYYPELPQDERVRKLVQDGCSNEQIAMRLDITLKAVLDLRKEASKKSIVNDPRALFMTRINDINDAFDEAKKVFFDDPTSETSYKMMNDFAKTLRELMKEYRDLEDPKVLAQQITRQSIRPLVNTLLSVIVTNMKATIKNMNPFLKVQEQELLATSIGNGLKLLQSQVNSDYNNSVSVLETIFNVDLSNLKIHEIPKQEQMMETTEQTESAVGASVVVGVEK
jgi:DNA-binding CsgD family transcriptional regulator